MRHALRFACVLVAITAGAADFVPPVIRYPAHLDIDNNRVLDDLDRTIDVIAAKGPSTPDVRVIVVLEAPPTSADLASFAAAGGVVGHVYGHALYGLSATIPAEHVRGFANRMADIAGVVYIAEDGNGKLTLDQAARIARVRPAVWDGGYTGSSATTIAIIDTGLDGTHADFSGRVSAGWVDVTSEAYGIPRDPIGHGTFVAGVALGSGASYGLGHSGMTVTSTVQGQLPSGAPVGPFGPLAGEIIEVKGESPGQIVQTLTWIENGTTSTTVYLQGPDRSLIDSRISSSSPSTLRHDAATAGFHLVGYATSSGPGGSGFAGEATFPFSPSDDGYPLFRGVAPGARVLGVKILTGCGESLTFADALAGVNWIVAHRDEFDIRVANMSWTMGRSAPPIDAAVNNAVANGIVMVASAGNDYPSRPIAAPATALRAIAVGALTDQGAVTNFSSNGPGYGAKPDVIAPSGSYGTLDGGFLHAAESNDGDGCGELPDLTPDNLMSGAGTSAASPMVAGLAAVLIDAREQSGNVWGSTEAEALEIKGLILMTATETNRPGELNWDLGFDPPDEPSGNDPTLDRGGHDRVEGYGRINADAAVEALTNVVAAEGYDDRESVPFGAGPTGRKARAWRVRLAPTKAYGLSLDVPLDADIDLFLYQALPDANGIPVLAASSATPGGADETIDEFVPGRPGTFVIVAKLVSGEGEATFEILSTNLPRRPRGRATPGS